MGTRPLVLASLLVLLSAGPGRASLTDPAFTESPFISAGDLPGVTSLAWAPDASERLFVTLKDGNVRVVKKGALLPTPFATLTPIYLESECGLLGIAFDPDFLTNRYVYLFVTVSASEQQIVRYTANGDIGTEKTTIVAGLPTRGVNHDGGALGFGIDGKLYWGIGDLGNGTGTKDDLSSLASKIGRANLDGTPVSDNPFVDGAGPNADHIWARGFRNPFTLTFQPATGLLWVQDVGNAYERIFIVRRGDHAGWDSYEILQPDGFIDPVIKYRTNGTDRLLLAASGGVNRAGGIVTFTTNEAHGFLPGEKITIEGVSAAELNGDYFVGDVGSPTTFRSSRPGPDVIAGGGTASTQALGGCVTGGAFYEAGGLPAGYRGNLFFGEFNADRILRAVIDPATNSVSRVDLWAEGIDGATDVTLGPDGALYYGGVNTTTIYRASPNFSAQGLVVSPSHLWLAEGRPAMFMVRLAQAPAADVTVSAARSGGDADVAVSAGASLTFTSGNWSTPQPVTVVALRDLDSSDDVASIGLQASGLGAEAVTVHLRDDNGVQLRVSATTLAIDEGESGTFTVVLTGQPSLDVPVTVSRSAGDADLTVSAGAALTFTRESWATPQTVTVAATPDGDGVDDLATVTVASAGLMPQTVAVSSNDDDPPAPDLPPDAGADAAVADGPGVDGAAVDGARSDASGGVSTGGAGCDCRAGGEAGGAGWLLLLGVALLFWRRNASRES